MDEESAPVDTEPDVALPVLKPVPVHDVAFVELQVRSEEPPEETLEGLAERDAVGDCAAAVTVTVALAFAEPLEPEQVTVYVFVTPGATAKVPLVAPPVEKSELVQDVACVELQLKTEVCPLVMDEGLAESDAVGV